MTIRIVLALVALLVTMPLRAAAQTVPTIDDILKLPLSPGSVAWLVQYVSQPLVQVRLDWAAVQAVLQWRYAPTLVDGVPVPVLLTAFVQFSLR